MRISIILNFKASSIFLIKPEKNCLCTVIYAGCQSLKVVITLNEQRSGTVLLALQEYLFKK